MTNRTSRKRQFLRSALVYTCIVGISLLIVDGVCIAFGLFPPTRNFGDPVLGWRPADATGRMAIGKCIEFSANDTVIYQRNEDGVRTSLSKEDLKADLTDLKVGVTGDSQTELCAPNAALHSGVLQAELDSQGVPTVALPYGAGRYSPLQAYLAFRDVLKPYGPQALALNVYTGNDFYDMLRSDDRPHFIAVDSGYAIAAPTWYALDDPTGAGRSRVLFALRKLSDRVGVRGLYFRLTELRRLGAQHGGGVMTVLAYIRDLWKARETSVGYSDAFTAQMLNQQLFFYRFPGSREESVRRMRVLMQFIRAENPGMILVMSPLPSYELVGEIPVDSALMRVLDRLPISYEEGRSQENSLYEQLRTLATEEEWLFVDNLAALRAYRGPDRLYNDFDYHLLPTASGIVGRAQAAVIGQMIHAERGDHPINSNLPPKTGKIKGGLARS